MSVQTITKLTQKVEKLTPVITKSVRNNQRFLKKFIQNEKENNLQLRDILANISQDSASFPGGGGDNFEELQALTNKVSYQKMIIDQLTEDVQELQEENNLAQEFLGKLDKKTLLAALGGGAVLGTTAVVSSAGGGNIVEYLTGDVSSTGYDPSHGGKNYHDHIAFKDTPTRDAAMSYLKSKGWYIGSVEGGKHADGSYHYSKQAFDVPFYPNQSIKGVTDDRKGETSLSSMLRRDLEAGGFAGSGVGTVVSQKKVTPDSTQSLKPQPKKSQQVVAVPSQSSGGVNRTSVSSSQSPQQVAAAPSNFKSVMQFHNVV